MKPYNVGIVGAAGYTAGELIRLIINHPNLHITSLQSNSQKGKKITDIHQDLIGDINLRFSQYLDKNTDIIFICSGHGKAKQFIDQYSPNNNQMIIDLGDDFRLNINKNYKGRQYIYGLPEYQKNKIKTAKSIANPGCFATAIQLALLPITNTSLPTPTDIHIHGITGSTGAGQSLTQTSHYSWRNNNISTYKVFTHQHLNEINETLTSINPNFNNTNLNFIPVRGNFTRGIFVTAYWKSNCPITKLKQIYQDCYKNTAFTHTTNDNIHLKQVVNTNKALINIQEINKNTIVTTAFDNLLKGASGQAIQNLNIMLGIDEKTGLNLKATTF